jgi:hypothetical protein
VADGLQVARHPRLQRPHRRRLLVDDLQHRLDRGGGAEGRPPGQAFVQDGAQGVDVRRGADQFRLARRLLGGHVTGRAQDRPGGRQAVADLDALGQSEVGDLGGALFGQQHVGGLEISVNDALAVGGVHRLGQRRHQAGRLGGRQRLALQLVGQAAAGDELQGEVGMSLVPAGLEKLHDVRVLQRRDRLGLGHEPLQVLGGGVGAREDHLQRHDPVDALLECLVNDAHAPAAQLPEDLVAGHQRLGVAGLLRRGRVVLLPESMLDRLAQTERRLRRRQACDLAVGVRGLPRGRRGGRVSHRQVLPQGVVVEGVEFGIGLGQPEGVGRRFGGHGSLGANGCVAPLPSRPGVYRRGIAAGQPARSAT